MATRDNKNLWGKNMFRIQEFFIIISIFLLFLHSRRHRFATMLCRFIEMVGWDEIPPVSGVAICMEGPDIRGP